MGLAPSDAGVSEHEFLSSVLECAASFDQLNVSEIAAFEHISRRYQMLEETYAERLRGVAGHTTLAGGDFDPEERSIFMGSRFVSSGPLVCPALAAFVASKVAERSSVFKERRKGREERQLASGSHADPSGAGSAGGGGARPSKAERARTKAAGKG